MPDGALSRVRGLTHPLALCTPRPQPMHAIEGPNYRTIEVQTGWVGGKADTIG